MTYRVRRPLPVVLVVVHSCGHGDNHQLRDGVDPRAARLRLEGIQCTRCLIAKRRRARNG